MVQGKVTPEQVAQALDTKLSSLMTTQTPAPAGGRPTGRRSSARTLLAGDRAQSVATAAPWRAQRPGPDAGSA